MTEVYPEFAPVLGAVKVAAVVAVADPAAPKLATEINAATSVGLTCALMAGGWAPTGSQGKGTRRRRLCDRSTAEVLNAVQYSIGALMYTTGNPQAPETEITNLMVEGARIYIVERLGEDEDNVWAVADRVRTHYVELGAPIKVYDTADDNGEFTISQEVVYVNGSGPVDGVVAA